MTKIDLRDIEGWQKKEDKRRDKRFKKRKLKKEKKKNKIKTNKKSCQQIIFYIYIYHLTRASDYFLKIND